MNGGVLIASAFLGLLAACEHRHCLTLGERQESLGGEFFNCGEATYSDPDITVDVIDCLVTAKKSCTAAVGTVSTSTKDGVKVYGLVVGDDCQINLLTGESPAKPGVAFTERTCDNLIPTTMIPGFTVDECTNETVAKSCD